MNLIIEGLRVLCNSHYQTKLLLRNNVNIRCAENAKKNGGYSKLNSACYEILLQMQNCIDDTNYD